jgi:hypothetical protein
LASGTITPVLLSGSTNGRGIEVTQTTLTGADTVHTAVSGTAKVDYLTIEAANHHTATVKLTLQFGGSDDADKITVDLAADRGLVTVVEQIPLNNGLVVSAFADQASVVNLFGYVTRVEL